MNERRGKVGVLEYEKVCSVTYPVNPVQRSEGPWTRVETFEIQELTQRNVHEEDP